MGYSNKRRRSKRKRTRTLNAIQNPLNSLNSASSSDASSIGDIEQSSSNTNFCSTFSHHTGSFMECEHPTIPNSIFLDDVNTSIPIHVDRNLDVSNEDNDQQCSVTDPTDEQFMFHPNDDMSDDDDIFTVCSTPSSTSKNNNENHCSPCSVFSSQEPHHRFEEMTLNETASYRIMTLLDTAGAPRICYNRLVALLKKLVRKEGFDVRRTLNRETLMRRLGNRCRSKPRIETSIINKQEVFRFMFMDMLQDLLYSSGKNLHIIAPSDCDLHHPPAGTEHELWNTSWMRDTFAMQQYSNFDINSDVMLPIILYMDKTGTDVNQRYSLEPVLFSLAAIPREQRESRHAWRHLGFVPQRHENTEDESSSSLQFYHHCLSYLLDGLRDAQNHPPVITIKLPNGDLARRRALLPLMIVMGDQLSQDTLCGRLKSNSGGAGRVHRSCMCSYLHIDDPYHQCKKVSTSMLHLLTTYAMVSDEDIDTRSSAKVMSSTKKEERLAKNFLLKQRTMFRSILRHPFTTHPINNAFDGINFGAWSGGIHDASLDDFMHSVEAGMISYIAETVYDGLTKKEKESVEQLTRSMLSDQRCSINSTYPRWRLQPGFSRQTLMTSGERVGSILALSLSLQNPRIRETIRLGHHRQVQKYLDFTTDPNGKPREHQQSPLPQSTPAPEFYLDQYMHKLDDNLIRHTLEQMVRHGFLIDTIDDLDPFQINQLIWHCSEIFKTTYYPDNYPSDDIDGLYTDLGRNFLLPREQWKLAKHALQTDPSKLLKIHRYRNVEGTTGKHFKKKFHRKGEGSSAAILSSNMGSLTIFLEYVLCFHAFCKYSWTLPLSLQRSYDNIMAGNRFVVEYFQKLFYRGNNTVDSRFPKIHAQCRIGPNIESLNSIMNFCCETGERLLKTEAKGISRTAQQRGDATFLTQTMARLQDRSLMDTFAMYLDEQEDKEPGPTPQCDRFARIHPHFIYFVDSEQVLSVNRNNDQHPPNDQSGYLSTEVMDALKVHEPAMKRFDIYNEVILRDNSRLRAFPNYTQKGPWYDFVNVSWERSVNGVHETYLLPAKCICFFLKQCVDTGEKEIMALIHTVDQLSAGKIPGRVDTLLTRNYKLQYDAKGRPVTHLVPVASIDSAIRCFPHEPSSLLFNPALPGITSLLPRNHWAYMWMALNEALMESNLTDQGGIRKAQLVSLCNNTWLESVREKYKRFLDTLTE